MAMAGCGPTELFPTLPPAVTPRFSPGRPFVTGISVLATCEAAGVVLTSAPPPSSEQAADAVKGEDEAAEKRPKPVVVSPRRNSK